MIEKMILLITAELKIKIKIIHILDILLDQSKPEILVHTAMTALQTESVKS